MDQHLIKSKITSCFEFNKGGWGLVGGGGINIAYCTYQNVRKQLHMYFRKTFHKLLTQVLLFSGLNYRCKTLQKNVTVYNGQIYRKD